MAKLNIILNGNNFLIEKNCNLTKLVAILELDIKKIAIEKDLEIINPQDFNNVFLKEGSRIEIVHFIGGG